jgi:SAM-dependent methyltransferase
MGISRLINQLYTKGYQWRLNTYYTRQLNIYTKNGCKPWSEGYELFKWNFINKVINDENILNKFYNRLPLPSQYGEFLDERVVEYPWLLSRLSSDKINLLDVGSTLNYPSIIEHRALLNKKIFLLTLAPEANCFWKKGISYIFSDARNLPFKDNLFDAIASISTLEHIGMDNTLIYTSDKRYKESCKFAFVETVKELHRVLKDGGRCFVTVPFGQYQYDEFQQQFDSEMVGLIESSFNPSSFTETYFQYKSGGWNVSTKEECINCKYFNIHKTKYYDKKSSLDYDKDFAAAARAVVALEMIK